MADQIDPSVKSGEQYLSSLGYSPSVPFPRKPEYQRVTPGMLADEASLGTPISEADVLRKMAQEDPQKALFLAQHAAGSGTGPGYTIELASAKPEAPQAPVAKPQVQVASPISAPKEKTKTEDFYSRIQPYFASRKAEALAAGMKDPEIAVMVGRLKQSAIDSGTPSDEGFLINKAADAIAVQRAHKDSVLAEEQSRVEERVRSEQSYIEKFTPKSARDLADAQKLGLEGEYGTKIAHESNSAEALAAAGQAVDARNKELAELDQAAVKNEEAKALAVEAQAEKIRQATDEYRNFKVDPNRYMREAYSSGWVLLGNFLSSYGSTITKTANAVPAMIDAAIDRDLKGQLAESEKKGRGVEMEKSYMTTLEQKFGSKAAALKFQKSVIMDKMARDLERIDMTKLNKNAQANVAGLKTELEAKSRALQAGLLGMAERQEASLQAQQAAAAAARAGIQDKTRQKLFDAHLEMLKKNPGVSSISIDRATGMPIGLDSTGEVVQRVPTLLGKDAEDSKRIGTAVSMEGGQYSLKPKVYATPEAAAKESKIAEQKIAFDRALSDTISVAEQLTLPKLTPAWASEAQKTYERKLGDLILQMKTIEELGALQRPDVEALQKILPSPDETFGSTVVSKLKGVQADYRKRFTATETKAAPKLSPEKGK